MRNESLQLARILVDATAHRTDVSGDMKTFVSFLAEHHLLDRWREIEQAIHQVWKEKFGASTIRVLSAHQLTQDVQKMIEEIAPGAEISTVVDERLVGGAVIRIDDTRIDGSLVGRLKSLKRTLTSVT